MIKGNHRTRMSEIFKWKPPPRGSVARDFVNQLFAKAKSDPDYQRKYSKRAKKGSAIVQIQDVNGLDLPASRLLRDLALEYSSRLFGGDLNDMPSSFNVAEAFVKYNPKYAIFRLRPETDYSFSIFDFIEFVTSERPIKAMEEQKELVEEGRIYSFSSIDDPSDFLFGSAAEYQFGVASVSFVRFGNELTLALLTGRHCNIDEETKTLKNRPRPVILPHRRHLDMDSKEPVQALQLHEGSALWKTIALARLDVKSETIDARYVLKDCGPSYDVVCDDMSILADGAISSVVDDPEKFLSDMTERLKPYRALFDLCKTCALLPHYVNERDEYIGVERHPTGFLDFRKKLKNKKWIEPLGGSPVKKTHRQLLIIPSSEMLSPDAIEFYPPKFVVESSGFWKKLDPSAQGEDKQGNLIHGRTWVRKTLSWSESSVERSTLSFASRKHATADNPNAGTLYVMRSAAHARDVFKIGMTRRSTGERSAELSRGTGIPDDFLTVKQWYVDDCVEVERRVHEELAHFRINPRREFFRADFREIHAAIERVLTTQNSIT